MAQILGIRGGDKESNIWKIRLQLMKPVTWVPLIWGELLVCSVRIWDGLPVCSVIWDELHGRSMICVELPVCSAQI